MSVTSVKVSNVSLEASEREIKEFFSFSGDIRYLEIKSEEDDTKTAYVTFTDAKGAETAVLLSGATIVDKMVKISIDSEYQLPPEALTTPPDASNAASAFQKAEDMVSSMLAQGFLLGKDAVKKARELDEKHQLSMKLQEVDQKIGLTEKINMGTAMVNDKVKEVDAKFQVSEKTKSALAAAEQKVNSAGSAIMKNRYILTSTTWVTGAFSKVAKAAGDVGQKAQEKMESTEPSEAAEPSQPEPPHEHEDDAKAETETKTETEPEKV